MLYRYYWNLLFLTLISTNTFSKKPFDCSSEHIQNITVSEQQEYHIGSNDCATAMTIDTIELARQSSLTLDHGNYTLQGLTQNESAVSQWFQTNSSINNIRINNIRINNSASMTFNSSSLIQTGKLQLSPDATINLSDSNIIIHGEINFINPDNNFNLSNHSSLIINGRITLEISEPLNKRHFIISNDESNVNFGKTAIEIKTHENIYIPSTISIYLFSFNNTPKKYTGTFHLTKNNSIARKFDINSKGRIRRPSPADTYSKVAPWGYRRETGHPTIEKNKRTCH